ncbi:hypothetical protein HMPREF0813_00437 [Streptococcus anginosus F0211]|uniref:Uncharacterized protein n=1 Tax=Streptococcus anginosus F0211 TaxID=706437 RepID=E6IZM2_STRAP|nr:hypothetical protein HMPREF0813_00437 [Streptococcus anginosus F0211]
MEITNYFLRKEHLNASCSFLYLEIIITYLDQFEKYFIILYLSIFLSLL